MGLVNTFFFAQKVRRRDSVRRWSPREDWPVEEELCQGDFPVAVVWLAGMFVHRRLGQGVDAFLQQRSGLVEKGMLRVTKTELEVIGRILFGMEHFPRVPWFDPKYGVSRQRSSSGYGIEGQLRRQHGREQPVRRYHRKSSRQNRQRRGSVICRERKSGTPEGDHETLRGPSFRRASTNYS